MNQARAPQVRRFQGRGNAERSNYVSAAALTGGGATAFSKEFRLGHGWRVMWLHISVVFTVGTGTTALSDATLRLLKKLFLKTDRQELICNEGGRAMWYIAQYIFGAKPSLTTFAASSATYEVYVPIIFCDPLMTRPEDTILDTSRYQALDFEVTLGTTSDLLGTPGTSSYTATIDIDVERTYGAVHPKAKPHYYIAYDHRPPQDASAVTSVEMEKSVDLSIKRIYAFFGDTGTAGVPWSGAANDTYPTKTNIQDQERFIEKDRKHAFVQALNKSARSLENVMAGVEVYDFVQDGAITAALSTGDKSSLQFQLTQSGAAASSIWTVTTESVRALKGV